MMNWDTINAYWQAAWPAITITISVASALDMSLPQPEPGSHWLPVRKAISFLAVNVKNASNGAQPPLMTWLFRIVQPMLLAQQMTGSTEANPVTGVSATPQPPADLVPHPSQSAPEAKSNA